MASWPTRTSTLSTGRRRSSSPPSAPGWPRRPRRVATMPGPNGFRRPAKPTAAAWIVNRLALRHKDARQRLADLGEGLRAAHAALDGTRIRELSAEQHRLIDELTGAALRAADVRTPSAAVREDVTGTLQAAVADPQVRARLGRLTRPERWSGFGDLGDLADVGDAPSPDRSRRAPPRRIGTRSGCAPPSPPPKTPKPGPTQSCPRARPDAMRPGSGATRRPGNCGTPSGNCAAPRATTTRRKRPAAPPRKRCSRPGPGYDRAEPAAFLPAGPGYQHSRDFFVDERAHRTSLGRKPA